MIYVLYHSNCYDGFGAAYSAWKLYGERANYVPVSYGFPPPEMPDAEEIFIVDFSYPKETILQLHELAPVTVLDHHKTAKEDLESLIRPDGDGPRVIFDMDRSGAKITWEFLHRGIPCPPLIEHISDRDLWKFKLPNSAKIHKALVSYPMDFLIWDNFVTGNLTDSLAKEGETCERLYSQLVSNITKSAWMGDIDGNRIPIVNTSIAWSEVGADLLSKFPESPFVASFTVFDTQVMWSLRSRPGFDVSVIAKKFGGGGHANASGFKTSRY